MRPQNADDIVKDERSLSRISLGVRLALVSKISLTETKWWPKYVTHGETVSTAYIRGNQMEKPDKELRSEPTRELFWWNLRALNIMQL